MRCPSCGAENAEGMNFCEQCGTALGWPCPSCGHELKPTAKFCGKCGTALAASEPRPAAQRRTRAGAMPAATAPEAERRQLMVMFCDLVGSTPLAEQLDPEDLRQVILAYQQTCAEEIRRFEGYLARYIGDGLLVYFGYPQAHEDDAQRAIRTGLGIVAALPELNTRVQHTVQALRDFPLQVRIGIHTGLVVVGDMGGGDYRDPMAIVGETPNIAARIQGQAEPNTVLISAVTYPLVEGLFEYEDRGRPELKGVSTPLTLYRVVKEGEVQSRFQVVARKGLIPLVGREHEYSLLRERWERAKEGAGQVVLLGGEPGIGKSRLVEALKETLDHEGARCLELRCSPYAQNSALQPVIEHLQRRLHFRPDELPEAKLEKLRRALTRYRFPQADTLPLLASLLSLPQPEGYPPLSLSLQKQKEKTQEAVVAWLCEEAKQETVTYAWEDLHWADPSTLELLTLFLDQIPTTRLLAVMTFRPEFVPPWGPRSYLSQLTLSRLGRSQVELMVERVTGGKALPREVMRQIASKTDGVPLFVEELTKMVVESDLVREVNGHYELSGPLPPLAIPSTLQDSLMARLDRLATVREIAQVGATLGREFNYDLLQAVSPLDEETLRGGLRQLVEAELVYQSGVPPQARYLFKHALVQDAAYQSLLKSRRQQLHQQVAQVLVERFPETAESQPELVAHHYTEAGLTAQAIPYWERAGQRAIQRSANEEAVAHLTTGIELLKTLPNTPARTQQHLTLQTALSSALLVTKGLGAHEVREAYDQARQLCSQLGDSPQLFRILLGLSGYYLQQEEMPHAIELAQQCLAVAERQQDMGGILAAHGYLCLTWFFHGHPARSHEYCEQTMARYDFEHHHALAFDYGLDSGVLALAIGAWALWYLGYPEQARKRCEAAVTLARQVGHPYTLAWALNAASWLYWYRQEGQRAYELADEVIAFATQHEFPHWVAMGLQMRGNALARLGQWEEGMAQLKQGLEAYQATGASAGRDWALAELARGCLQSGQYDEGLRVLSHDIVNRSVDEACLTTS
jgi:class 3 adenylate cyclase/tetratricopeptide (TPR) repeat protein